MFYLGNIVVISLAGFVVLSVCVCAYVLLWYNGINSNKNKLSLSDWEQRQMLTNHSKNINITAMDEHGSVERQITTITRSAT